MDIQGLSTKKGRTPKQYTVRLGQERGVLGHREDKEGNRRDRNPDGSRSDHKKSS